jgi:tRNA threonylcarbamoyladenosine biosynthesis protein TsaE
MTIARSEEETFETGRSLAAALKLPAHVLLYGELGSGKTAFTRGLCAGFGIDDPEEVASPTFTLVNQYHGRNRIYHIDLYRMDPGEANATDGLGLEELFDDPGAAVIVEWAERLGAAEPPGAVKVMLEYVDENSRRIDVAR